MPLLCGCCGRRAEDAVVSRAIPTASPIQPNNNPKQTIDAPSEVSSSLAYMDALTDEKDLKDINSNSENKQEVFFDAAAAAVTSSESNNAEEMGPSSEREVSVEVIHPISSNSTDKNVSDEDLLAPQYRSSQNSTRSSNSKEDRDPTMTGFPGHLTPKQLHVYQQFRDELLTKSEIHQQMVYNYSSVHLEPESYALCRFLRERNFHLKDVWKHMDKHVAAWEAAAQHDFYPNVEAATGAPLSVLLTQFPSLYYGNSKEGYPCCYFSAGKLSPEGVECITDGDRLANTVWYNLMHDLKYSKFPEAKKRNPHFLRLEQITVMNLKGLSRSQLAPATYRILQQVDAVAAIFPEMLHSLVIINAPGFFKFAWNVISGFVDAKTRNMIEIYSSQESGKNRLLELIDCDELPSDYGGGALPTSEIILRQGRTEQIPLRQIVERLHARKTPQEFLFELKPEERLELKIHTRSPAPANFVLHKDTGSIVHELNLPSVPSRQHPTGFDFGLSVMGPGEYTLKYNLGTQSPRGNHHFLMIGEIFRS